MSGSERSLATVLFTDIVGSTERASEIGDSAWRTLLEEHNRVEHEKARNAYVFFAESWREADSELQTMVQEAL